MPWNLIQQLPGTLNQKIKQNCLIGCLLSIKQFSILTLANWIGINIPKLIVLGFESIYSKKIHALLTKREYCWKGKFDRKCERKQINCAIFVIIGRNGSKWLLDSSFFSCRLVLSYSLDGNDHLFYHLIILTLSTFNYYNDTANMFLRIHNTQSLILVLLNFKY